MPNINPAIDELINKLQNEKDRDFFTYILTTDEIEVLKKDSRIKSVEIQNQNPYTPSYDIPGKFYCIIHVNEKSFKQNNDELEH